MKENYTGSPKAKLKDDPISALRQDYQQIKADIHTVYHAKVAGTEQGAALPAWQRLATELTIYCRLEQELFYPTLRQAGFNAQTADVQEEQLHMIATQLEEMRSLDFFQDDFRAPFARLQQLVIDHLEDEDREVLNYNHVAAHLNIDWAALGEAMHRRKAELSSQLHAGNILTPNHR